MIYKINFLKWKWRELLKSYEIFQVRIYIEIKSHEIKVGGAGWRLGAEDYQGQIKDFLGDILSGYFKLFNPRLKQTYMFFVGEGGGGKTA